MNDFKVGDKVTCFIRGKGVVVQPLLNSRIRVMFYDGHIYEGYTGDNIGFLYKGHGTFNIDFVEDKEPVYEYVVLFKYLNSGLYRFSGEYYKSLEEFSSQVDENQKPLYLIEDTKRERK